VNYRTAEFAYSWIPCLPWQASAAHRNEGHHQRLELRIPTPSRVLDRVSNARPCGTSQRPALSVMAQLEQRLRPVHRTILATALGSILYLDVADMFYFSYRIVYGSMIRWPINPPNKPCYQPFSTKKCVATFRICILRHRLRYSRKPTTNTPAEVRIRGISLPCEIFLRSASQAFHFLSKA
jgi:hypothetical protein